MGGCHRLIVGAGVWWPKAMGQGVGGVLSPPTDFKKMYTLKSFVLVRFNFWVNAYEEISELGKEILCMHELKHRHKHIPNIGGPTLFLSSCKKCPYVLHMLSPYFVDAIHGTHGIPVGSCGVKSMDLVGV